MTVRAKLLCNAKASRLFIAGNAAASGPYGIGDLAEKASTFGPLRNRAYRAFWTANMAANFGGMIQGVAAAWLMTTLTDSKSMVALVQASTTLPILVFSLAAGALADTVDRRIIMLSSQIFMLGSSLVLAILAYAGLLTPWLLLTLTFLVASGQAMNLPSWQATVGDIVPREDLGQAILLNGIGANATRTVGPAIGGIIVATAGPAVAFVINTVSYLGLISVLLRAKSFASSSGLPREPIARAVGAGLRYVFMSPNVEKVILRASVFGISAVAVQALLPLVARDMLGGGASTYGALLGLFGLGAILGAFASVRIRERLGNEWTIRFSFLLLAAAATTIGADGPDWVVYVAMLVAGTCWIGALALFNVSVQFATPRWVVARALSVYQTAVFGGMAAGSWLWGQVAEAYGLSTAFYAAAALGCVGAAIGFWLSMPDRTVENLAPVNRWQEPKLAIDLEQRSGPILISVEYIIPDDKVPEFLELMGARRRIRRRNGAHHWTLTRDLEHSDLWTESYQLANWIEYVRHNQRTTHADAENSEKLRAIHAGKGPPEIHRSIVRPPWRQDAEHPRAAHW